jgi:hypothetical protein
MDRLTEELVKAGVFVAAAGLKNDAYSRRIVSDGASRTVIDGPFAESRRPARLRAVAGSEGRLSVPRSTG